jgi:hypothetical protein
MKRAAKGSGAARRRSRVVKGKPAAARAKRATGKRERSTAVKSNARSVAGKPALLAGGNPQIAKAEGDAAVQAYIAAMPGWKREVGRRLDALVVRTVPSVRKAVNPLLHEVRETGVLPRNVTASSPSGRVEAQGRALRRHP